jgi:hypothetical protein
MKTIVLAFVLISLSSSLLTSSQFKKQGIDIHNSYTHTINKVSGVATSCNTVNLNVEPYNYNGKIIINI